MSLKEVFTSVPSYNVVTVSKRVKDLKFFSQKQDAGKSEFIVEVLVPRCYHIISCT